MDTYRARSPTPARPSTASGARCTAGWSLTCDIGIAAELGDVLLEIVLGRGEALARNLKPVLHLIELCLRSDEPGTEKTLLPVVLALLVGERVLGRFLVGELLPIGRLQRVDLQPRGREIGLVLVRP